MGGRPSGAKGEERAQERGGRGSRPGWAACWEGKGSWAREKGLGWVFLGRALGIGGLTGFEFLSNSYSFSKANTQILFEFKFQFEFKPNTQTKRTMHQHECNFKFLNLDKF